MIVQCSSHAFLYNLWRSLKYPYPYQGWSLKIARGQGVLIAKCLKEKNEAILETQGGEGNKPNNNPWWKY